MKTIDAYVRSPPPGYALLLSGTWGVGKSYVWRHIADRLRGEGFSVLTISAAGLDSLDSLEQALLEVSIEGIGTPAVREAGALVGKALLRLVDVQPNDITLKAGLAPGRTIVCIDDLERFGGGFPTLLGFILRLLDQAAVHCVLIADEDKAADRFEQYALHKERIVGKTLQVRSSREDFCRQQVEALADSRARDFLLANLAPINEVAGLTGLVNLRSVRFLLSELHSIFANLPAAVPATADARALVEMVGFWVAASTRGLASAETIAGVFASPGLGIAVAMEETRRRREDEDADESEHQVLDLLLKLGLREQAARWPRSLQLANLVAGQDVDHAALAVEFRFARAAGLLADPLQELNHFRELDDATIARCVGALRQELLDFREGSLQRWFDIFKTVYFVARYGLTAFTAEDWTEAAMHQLDALDPAGRFDEVRFLFPPSDATEGWVRERLLAFQDLAEDAGLVRDRASVRHELLAGRTVQDKLRPDFADADADSFLAALQAGPPAGVFATTAHFRSRLQVPTGPRFYAADRGFAAALAQRIRTQVPARRPMALRDAALHDLANVLEALVGQIDEYRG